MAELTPGALVMFLQEMVVDDNTLREDKPVLVQIRSIIPVLREGNLWPNQGFFLRISDLSHALYVSLPQEEDEMILYNKLHIGQCLYIEKLEAAYPVPLLKGIRPLPGRHPCHGNPKDLIPLSVLEKFLGSSSINEDQNNVINNPIQDPPCLSDSKETSNAKNNHFTKEHEKDQHNQDLSALGMSSNEASSDEGTGLVKEDNNDVIKVKKGDKLPSKSSIGRTSSLDQESNDKITKKQSEKPRSFGSSKGNLSEKTSRRVSIHRPRKVDAESTLSYRHKRSDGDSYYKGIRKCKTRYAKEFDTKTSVSTISTSSAFKRKGWTGKEAIKMVDIAETPLLKLEMKPETTSSANDSISGSSLHKNDTSDDNSSTITKKPVNVLSTKSSTSPIKDSTSILENNISEDPINCSEEVDCSSINDQLSADIHISWNFLPSSLVKLGQELLQRREIAIFAAMEALLEASAAERLLNCLSVYSEVVSGKEAEEYHQLVDKFFDLEHELAQNRVIFQPLTSIVSPGKTTDTAPTQEMQLAIHRKQNAIEWIIAALESDLKPVSDMIKTRGISMSGSTISTKRSKIELERRQDWVKGNALRVSEELANSLRNESNKWFLKYVEDYLDWVSSKTDSSEFDIQVSEMMCRIKKVSHWLDMRYNDKSMEDSDMEACSKVRSKIYEILLTHVERTARNAIAEC